MELDMDILFIGPRMWRLISGYMLGTKFMSIFCEIAADHIWW